MPEGVTVDGKFYPCDFDFRNVLKMLEIMRREDIRPDARDYLCIKCLISHKKPPKNARRVYDELCIVLFGEPEKTQEKPVLSFEHDAPLIRAAFLQVYKIDLWRDSLTWFEFKELLQGLPDNTKFSEIVGIRARPIPAPTKYNQKEREALIAAKQKVAIPMSAEEQQRNYENSVSRIFAGLMSMIQKEVKQ